MKKNNRVTLWIIGAILIVGFLTVAGVQLTTHQQAFSPPTPWLKSSQGGVKSPEQFSEISDPCNGKCQDCESCIGIQKEDCGSGDVGITAAAVSDKGDDCIEWVCRDTCSTGKKCCDNQCISTSDDSSNCGKCGNECKECVEKCENGKCVSTDKKVCAYYPRCIPKSEPCSCGDKVCETCTEVCIGGACVKSGRELCEDGRCVPISAITCDCSPSCAPCIESCRHGSCESTGLTLCSDGTCAYGFSDCQKCDPPCAYCTEHCVMGKCRGYNARICPDGSCITKPERCPGECTPPCDPCLEECGSDGVCRFVWGGSQRCPDGRCIGYDDVCIDQKASSFSSSYIESYTVRQIEDSDISSGPVYQFVMSDMPMVKADVVLLYGGMEFGEEDGIAVFSYPNDIIEQHCTYEVEQETSLVIGPAGGEISLEDAKMTMPVGSYESETEISIRKLNPVECEDTFYYSMLPPDEKESAEWWAATPEPSFSSSNE